MANILIDSLGRVVTSVLSKESPLYVQYYITARCNLRCEQCNVIYANADQMECSTSEAVKVIESLGRIGTTVLLLTGGEPFIRNDLPELVGAAVKAGMHPRIQTNGLASREILKEVVAAGANDISISLDSLNPETQDTINGEFENSWAKAMATVSLVSEIFPRTSFAAFGCVLSPRNIGDVVGVIKFATEIGWWVSLVPAHSTPRHEPRAFSSFSSELEFPEETWPKVLEVLNEVKKLKKAGYNVYDSDIYLDDMYRFITKQPTKWRDRNNGVCDAPTSYFAVTPNGEMAVCCDWRLQKAFPLYSDGFVDQYRRKTMFPMAREIAKACSGCMYGSYPEITTTLRFGAAAMERVGIFFDESQVQIQQKSVSQLQEIARKILDESR